MAIIEAFREACPGHTVHHLKTPATLADTGSFVV